MAKTITRMAGEGLVTVRTSSTDARSTEVMITPAGLKLLEQARDKVKGVFKEALRGLSKTEVQLLNSLSARIFENLEP
jgi:DNA-binding MarR family transcriptional regulator